MANTEATNIEAAEAMKSLPPGHSAAGSWPVHVDDVLSESVIRLEGAHRTVRGVIAALDALLGNGSGVNRLQLAMIIGGLNAGAAAFRAAANRIADVAVEDEAV